MRRFFNFLCSCFLIIAVSNPIFAADALYRMLHADEVESFKKDQDALVVGQLIDNKSDCFKVRVLKVLNGKVSDDIIFISDDFTYGWRQDGNTPEVKDFCVMSLKKNGGIYQKGWGIFKADKGDYRILKLDDAKISGDVACIEWYVNSGGTQNDFYFNGGTAYARQLNGQSIQIYPKPAPANPTLDEVRKTAVTEPLKEDKNGGISKNLINVVLIIAVVTAVLVVIRLRKKA